MRILTALTLACLLPASMALANEEQLTLRAGVPTGVASTTLSLLLTGVQDERCPANVDCYWEGMIRVEIAVTPAGALPATIILCNLCDDATRTARVAGHDITLTSLSPSTETLATFARPPLLHDYSVAVSVSP